MYTLTLWVGFDWIGEKEMRQTWPLPLLSLVAAVVFRHCLCRRGWFIGGTTSGPGNRQAAATGFSRVVAPRDYQRSKKDRQFANKKTSLSQVHGMQWIQCEDLQSAINEGIVRPIPKRTPRSRSATSQGEWAPGKLEELGLEEVMDDDDYDDAFL
jgi:hypothetical protein